MVLRYHPEVLHRGSSPLSGSWRRWPGREPRGLRLGLVGLLGAAGLLGCRPEGLHLTFRVPGRLAVDSVAYSVLEPGPTGFDCEALGWGEVPEEDVAAATRQRVEVPLGAPSGVQVNASALKLFFVEAAREGVVVARGCSALVGAGDGQVEVAGEPVLATTLAASLGWPGDFTLEATFAELTPAGDRPPALTGRWRRLAAGEGEGDWQVFNQDGGVIRLGVSAPAWSGPLRVEVVPRWSSPAVYGAMSGPTPWAAPPPTQRDYTLVRLAAGRQALYSVEGPPAGRLLRLDDGGWWPTGVSGVQGLLAFARLDGGADGLVLRQSGAIAVVDAASPAVELLRFGLDPPAASMMLTALSDCAHPALLAIGRDGGKAVRSLTDGSRVDAHPLLEPGLDGNPSSGGCISDGAGGGQWVNPLTGSTALAQRLLFPDGGTLSWLATDGYAFLGADDGFLLLAGQPELTGGGAALVAMWLDPRASGGRCSRRYRSGRSWWAPRAVTSTVTG